MLDKLHFKWCEADDCIGYYCHNNNEEEIIVLTSDRDITTINLKKSIITCHIT